MKKSKHTIEIIKGTNGVLISAPHTHPIIKPEKNGGIFIKPMEVGVAKLIKEVCAETGSWGILIKGRGKINNWDSGLYDSYKAEVAKLIKSKDISLFFDLHGCKESRPFLLDHDFKMPNLHSNDTFLKYTLLKHFRKNFPGKKLSSGFFKTTNGIGNDTMTYYVRKNFKLPAIQLEINKKVRVNTKHLQTFIDALSNIINDYTYFINNKKTKEKHENTFIGVREKGLFLRN